MTQIEEIKNDSPEAQRLANNIEKLIQVSFDYKKTADEAKTKVKKEIYLKKLKKNNERIATYFTALKKLQPSSNNKD